MEKRFELPAIALAAVVAMVVARAWLCDDAFITFRVVDQMLQGNGPVYNMGERVQVYTHPLWFLLLAAWSGLGASLYPGTILLCLLVFGAGLVALCAAFRDRPLTLAAVLAALLFSRAAMDFATSGLETPLSFALAMTALLGLRTGRRALAITALALMPLNRPDLVVWALPFAFVVPAASWRGRLGVLALLAAPAAAWALFSTFYYGSPVPNTALAKLGDSLLGRFDQGLSYITASLLTDPGTLALIGIGAAVGFARARSIPLVRASLASLLLSLAYVLWAGGDFMLGRFMLPAIWASVAVLLASLPAPDASPRDRRWVAGLFGALAVSHAVSGHATPNVETWATPETHRWGLYYHGALDERRYYLPWLGLFAPLPLDSRGFDTSTAAKTEPELTWAMGMHAYLSPRTHAMVDFWALADPLLARLRPMPGGRPGHGFRPVPEQWWRWRDPAQPLGDARLDALAADLRLAHRSPDLVSAERFAAIVRLLRERSIRIDAIDTQRTGEWIDVAIWPRRLDRRAKHTGIPVAWISRDCNPQAPRYSNGYLIAAGHDGVAHVRCPAANFSREAFRVRGGSLALWNSTVPEFLEYESVPLTPERAVWIPHVSSWAFSGWQENPVPAIVISLLFTALALSLIRRKT